jgi:hypothetical protein
VLVSGSPSDSEGTIYSSPSLDFAHGVATQDALFISDDGQIGAPVAAWSMTSAASSATDPEGRLTAVRDHHLVVGRRDDQLEGNRVAVVDTGCGEPPSRRTPTFHSPAIALVGSGTAPIVVDISWCDWDSE